MSLLFRGVEVGGRRCDVRLASGEIVAVGDGVGADVGADGREEIVDGRGGALLPGLHDHHLHLRALAAAARSVRVGPQDVLGEDRLGAALRSAVGAWVRAVGYHDSVAGPLDRWVLDRLVPDRPVRVQYRSGELWVLNSAALAAAGAAGPLPPGAERDAAGVPNGRLWRLDAWLRDRLPAVHPDLASVSIEAAAAGITAFTDAGPDTSQADADALAGLVRDGTVLQRLYLLGPSRLQNPGGGGAQVLATKILLDDLTLPTLDDLASTVRDSHAGGRPVAVHCVTQVQVVLTIAALDAAGPLPGDRIEHASVVPLDVVPALRRLGVTVVTQPNFVAERGDEYLASVPVADQAGLYRVASLRAAGIPVAAGTDAPLGGCDVWAAMRAAVTRTVPSGRVLGAGERVSTSEALSLFVGAASAPGRPRCVAPGEAADLCLLRLPLRDALAVLDRDLVAMTVIGGQVVSRKR